MSKTTFDVVKIGQQHKDCFVPMKGHLSSFQNFGMYMAYPTLFKQCLPCYVDDDTYRISVCGMVSICITPTFRFCPMVVRMGNPDYG